MAAGTGEQLNIESESRTDEGMTSGEEMRIESKSRTDEGMTSDEETTSGEDSGSESDTDDLTIRDQELRDAFVEEELDRWERFLELSSEEALASTKGMQQVFDIANSVSDHSSLFDGKVLNKLSDIEDGTALLLAVLGRGVSQCTKVNLGKVFVRGLKGREAIALCANLKSNTNIKILHLHHQKKFGTPQMCAVLSNALTTNKTLTDLRLDSVKMTPVALRCLVFGGRSRSSWHPTKLETHLAVQVVKRSDDSGEISKLRNEIKMELEKLERGGLFANMTLQRLQISFNNLFDTTSLAVFLSENSTLKSLDVCRCRLDFFSARVIANALKCNANLESLDLQVNEIGYDGVELIFESLSQNIREAGTKLSRPPNNTTLKSLRIGGIWNSLSPASRAVEPLVLMLETNTSLTALHISGMPFKPDHWTQQILPTLAKNKTLETLGLSGCGGLTTDAVREAFLIVLQENNTGLLGIDLGRTSMEDWQGRINEELRIKAEYGRKLKDQSMVTPTSGRLVLCGFEFAGKTTIHDTMERIFHPGRPGVDFSKMAWKRLLQMIPCLQQILFGIDAPMALGDRTRGFDILVLPSEPLRVSVWDFAGQAEYYALHDYLFPDVKNSCFVYVCSSRCSPDPQNFIRKIKMKAKMKEEFHYWLRFIASNSKVSPQTSGDGNGLNLPSVVFVLTNQDTLLPDDRGLSLQWAKNIVVDLKKEFQGVLDLCEGVCVVDARIPKDVLKLMEITTKKLEHLLESSSEFAICKEVRTALIEWSALNQSNPMMTVSYFGELCERSVAKVTYVRGHLSDINIRKAVLSYLNDVGDIIYPKDSDFIVVNPRWFGLGVLGHLIDAIEGAGSVSSELTPSQWNGFFGRTRTSGKVDHENGFVTRDDIRTLVGRSLDMLDVEHGPSVDMVDMLIKLMMSLEMCFKEEPEVQNCRLFIPALFDGNNEEAAKGERRLRWTLQGGTVYLGRRLQCQNKATTFLTPGFFPRLQVSLVNYMRDSKLFKSSPIEVSRNLIEFIQNGQQIFVEYSGDIDYFIDILVKSSNSHKETLQFMKKHLVDHIRDFCAGTRGCQGVILEEAVIRPSCVENLDLCVARKGHSVLVSELKDMIEENGKGYRHPWPRNGTQIYTDCALDLLEGEGSYSAASSSSTTTSGSGRGDDQHKTSKGDGLPKYYLSIKDIGFQGSLNAWKGLTPFKLHLYCDGDEGLKRCKVKGQPGRDIALDNAEHGLDFSLLKPVVKFLWGKFGPGISIDTWIDRAFDRSSIPATTKKKLEELINSGGTKVPVSEVDLVKELEDHIARTPGRLEEILNVKDADNIWKDFWLSRAEYSTPAGKIRWLCDSHYSSARDQNKLKANPR